LKRVSYCKELIIERGEFMKIYKNLFCISVTLILFIASCSTLDTSSTKSKNLITMQDFFKNPDNRSYQISNTGKYIAFMKPWESRMNIFIQELDSNQMPQGNPRQLTFVKERDIAGFKWKNDSHILYSKDFSGDENFHIFSVNTKTNQEIDLTPFSKVRSEILNDLRDVSSNEILVSSNKRNPEIFDVYRLNIETGRIKMVAKNPGKFNEWFTDHQGHVRIASMADGLITKIYTRANESEKFKEIIQFDYKNVLAPLFFDFKNENFYAASNLNSDKSEIVLVNSKTGRIIKKIYSHPEVDVYELNYSKKRKVLTDISYTTWKNEKYFLDKQSQIIDESIKSQISESNFYISSETDDENFLTVIGSDDRTRSRIYFYNVITRKLNFIVDSTPWLNKDQLSEMKPIVYKSRDGLMINGYLTLPKNRKSDQNLPLVVNPHGGPWARDNWRYNPEVQFLANRGYAVLQMNFRGSTGYGKSFLNASFKQWGKNMQNDITDGVQYLISQGIVNPQKICIYGGSYGGYATLAGIAFTPDLYACAIDYVGVSNLFTFMNTIPPYWKSELEKLYVMVGHPEKDKELLTSASPIFHVDKVKTPLFVAQGAKDPRVNVNESNQIVDALKKRGIEVQYMVKENEGHGFRNEENRFEFYGAMENFLGKYLN
jgi:dipeptidyl aminopeptidase/acylaminoacyl peptidase